jgi:hypothetical protein
MVASMRSGKGEMEECIKDLGGEVCDRADGLRDKFHGTLRTSEQETSTSKELEYEVEQS